ncbi:pyridoxamine 5'-phosphate oxidase family protein [Anaerorhabdus furcosa]|uniref:5-nitroimidazole antibiotic resistance protein n=1 Tax=Anaerorhabdus furcosa TaxID=118967 RepID=A0A1T4PUN1_9FIRM|nr:pyridoxamine 5'-phosphate oxidase family protein [Anaerorhabdus furcosa]SJZ95243.1 hypothetical protein SAMN02745191_2173 [Anaerorhabdus furcosa]
MFRELRRNKQILSHGECIEILQNATSGVLAVLGDDDYPYAVPLSFAYDEDRIIFHCAKAGHKLDAILKHEKVSFCVIDKDDVVPHEFTTYFRSVVLFGKAQLIEKEDAKRKATEILCKKYQPTGEGIEEEINKSIDHMQVVQINIEHMSGKEAKELVMRRGTE